MSAPSTQSACCFTGAGYYRVSLPSRGETRAHTVYIEPVPEHPDFKAPDPWLSVWLAAPEAGKVNRPALQGVQSVIEAWLIARIETEAAS